MISGQENKFNQLLDDDDGWNYTFQLQSNPWRINATFQDFCPSQFSVSQV